MVFLDVRATWNSWSPIGPRKLTRKIWPGLPRPPEGVSRKFVLLLLLLLYSWLKSKILLRYQGLVMTQ